MFAMCQLMRMTQLRAYLLAKGLKQSDFAAKIGVSRAYLSEIVSGDKTPSLDVAFRIEAATKRRIMAESFLKTQSGAAQ